MKELNKTIKSYKEKKLVNPEMVYDIINNANITDKKTRKDHVKSIKKNNK